MRSNSHTSREIYFLELVEDLESIIFIFWVFIRHYFRGVVKFLNKIQANRKIIFLFLFDFVVEKRKFYRCINETR